MTWWRRTGADRGKRLRYVLEPVVQHASLAPVADRLKALQDALGDLHDAHIWLMVLRDVVAERRWRRAPDGAGLHRRGTGGPGTDAAARRGADSCPLARLAQRRGRGVCPLPVGVGRPNGETILP